MLISIILHFSVLVSSNMSSEIDHFLIQIISVMTTVHSRKSKIAYSKHLLCEIMVPCSGSGALCQLFFFLIRWGNLVSTKDMFVINRKI